MRSLPSCPATCSRSESWPWGYKSGNVPAPRQLQHRTAAACCETFVHCVKLSCYNGILKSWTINSQVGGIGGTSRMERKMSRNLDVQEMPGDTEMRQEAQDRREVTPHDRTRININRLI